ncbi:MAG: 5'-methylthioadenosine/adenosylhomocysteine nucleosidase [Verrucomicrobiae bacterium]|nr:5'-methylthioadenosine/adenosylhomocysteine nucleosidase [Verrucomicrobiae bacterium]
MLSRFCFAVALVVPVFFTPATRAGDKAAAAITVVLGAQTREIAPLVGELKDKREHKILGLTFWEGELVGRRVVITRTASGKVNAAVSAALAIDHFHPSEVLVTGAAGSLNSELKPCDVVIAAKTVQHDSVRHHSSGVDRRGARNPITGQRNPVFLEAAPRLLDLAKRAATKTDFIPMSGDDAQSSPTAVRVVTGTVATGDAFVESGEKRKELRNALQADAVEMEGAAVAQVCHQFGVPCLVIRCVSDTADETAMADFETYAAAAAANAARLVYGIIRELAGAGCAPRP